MYEVSRTIFRMCASISLLAGMALTSSAAVRADEHANVAVQYRLLSWSAPAAAGEPGHANYQFSVHNVGQRPLTSLRLNIHVVSATPTTADDTILEVGVLPVGVSVETELSVPVLMHERSLLRTMPLRGHADGKIDVGGTSINVPVALLWESMQ